MFERHVLDLVLRPWITEHLPGFMYVGPEEHARSPYSFEFARSDDPHLRTTFPLDIEFSFAVSEATARGYLHANDYWDRFHNPGDVPHLDIGDEARGYMGQVPGSVGGWVLCRVGTCVFFLRSYTVTFEQQKSLARVIAAAVNGFPEVPRGIRATVETAFRRHIAACAAHYREMEEEDQKIPK